MTLLPTALPPFGGLRSPRGHLPLVAMDVRAEIAGLLATTRLRQSFENVLDEPIEATYVFPLPDRAGVTSFVAVLGGRRVEGVLKERQAARDEYDAAIAAGQRAAILEEDRSGVFSVRVGNLLAGETAEIDLVVTGPLTYDDGLAAFRFPLVVAPRYVPGAPLEGPPVGEGTALDTDLVPDATRISPPVLLPGQPNPVSLSLEASIDPLGLELSDLRSTLPAARTDDGGRVGVAVRPGERLDRDFVLRFRLAGAAPTTAAAITPDHPGSSDGTYAVTVVPPAAGGTTPGAAAPPADVAVVLDRSGSMSGWKMVAARRAAARIVDALGPADRLLVLAFDDRIEHPDGLGPALVPATDRNRYAAVAFLSRLDARGGTDMHRALEQATTVLSSGERPSERRSVLVLVTDGQIGQEDHVLATLAPHLGQVRVFTVGVDQAVNAGFLRRLADAGRGRCELVESEDALDEAMARIHRAVTPPLLSDVTVELDRAEALPATTTPARPPDCYPGAPCVIAGRYQGAPKTVTVHGTRADGSAWRQTAEAAEVENPAVRTAWARAHVRDLEDRYAVRSASELAEEIVAVSLAHSVLSRFTAFVAVDPSESTGSSAPRPVVQPVESPAGWAQPAPAMAMATGPVAAGGARVRALARTGRAHGPRPAPPPRPWAALARAVERLLERVAALLATGGTPPADLRHRLADELDELEAELGGPSAPAGVREAAARLAEAVRAWESVFEKAEELRDLVEGGGRGARRRLRFWR